MSHPTMGAWIEIIHLNAGGGTGTGRTPRWVRGLKFRIVCVVLHHQGRTPRWVRGLK